MHLLRHTQFFLTLLLASNLLDGQAVRTLQLDEAIRVAFMNNKDLAVAALEIERAKSRLRWSGRLANPELELAGGLDNFGLNEGERSLEIAFTQQYPLTSRLRDEKNLRRSQVLLAEAELAERRRQLAAEVAGTVIELVSSQRHNAYQREQAELQKTITDLLRTLVKRGEASRLDLAQAELEVRHIGQKGRMFKARENSHRLQLNQWLGQEPSDHIEVPFPFNLPADPPEQRIPLADILPRRPDHVLALSRINVADSALGLEKAKRLEDVAVRVFVERERSTDEPIGLENNTFAGIGISIPIPLRQKNEGGIEQAEISRKAAQEAAAALRFSIQAEYESAYRQRLDAWHIATEANGEILRLAKKNYDDIRLAYLEGQVSLIQVQRAQEQLLELKYEALEITVHFHQAEALLRKVTGNFPIQGAADNPPNKQ